MSKWATTAPLWGALPRSTTDTPPPPTSGPSPPGSIHQRWPPPAGGRQSAAAAGSAPRRRRRDSPNGAANSVRLALGRCSATPAPTDTMPSAGSSPPSVPRRRAPPSPTSLPASPAATTLHLPPWPPSGVDVRRRPHQGPPKTPTRQVGCSAHRRSDAGVAQPSSNRAAGCPSSVVVGARSCPRGCSKYPSVSRRACKLSDQVRSIPPNLSCLENVPTPKRCRPAAVWRPARPRRHGHKPPHA